jgi:hypothetical protein
MEPRIGHGIDVSSHLSGVPFENGYSLGFGLSRTWVSTRIGFCPACSNCDEIGVSEPFRVIQDGDHLWG